jgi:outer membrane protein
MIAVVTVAIGALRILTLDDAVATAHRNQPQIMQAHANTQAADARVIQRRAPLLPQLNATASYQLSTTNFAAQPGQNPLTMGTGTGMTGTSMQPKDLFANNWNFGLTLSQLVWDFGLTYDTYRASKSLAEATFSTEKTTVRNSEQQVRTTYFTARAQKALVQVAQETLANQDKHLQQIQGFVQVGVRPEIDLAQAKTDRANAQVQLITSENNYETAKAQLNQAMGVDASPDYDVADDVIPPIPGEDGTTESMLDEALKARPELFSFMQQVEAQRLALRAAKGAYAPAFSVSTTGRANGTDIADMAYNWNIGASMSWNIFGGLSTYGVVNEADANLRALEAQLAGEKQQVRFDVEQARLAVRAAKATQQAAQEAEDNARTRLRLAEGRYQAGVGSVIELGDAQVAMTTASAQRVQADYTLASARALMLHALGRP